MQIYGCCRCCKATHFEVDKTWYIYIYTEVGTLDVTTLLLKAALQAELDKHFFLQSSMVVASSTPPSLQLAFATSVPLEFTWKTRQKGLMTHGCSWHQKKWKENSFQGWQGMTESKPTFYIVGLPGTSCSACSDHPDHETLVQQAVAWYLNPSNFRPMSRFNWDQDPRMIQGLSKVPKPLRQVPTTWSIHSTVDWKKVWFTHSLAVQQNIWHKCKTVVYITDISTYVYIYALYIFAKKTQKRVPNWSMIAKGPLLEVLEPLSCSHSLGVGQIPSILMYLYNHAIWSIWV